MRSLIASLVYLFAAGQDIGLAGKVLMDGLYNSFVLLAVPLFIVAANIMNAGTISDRLLRFCVALVGRFRGGPRPRQRRGLADLLGHVRLGRRGRGGDRQDHHRDDDEKTGHYTRGYAAAITAASATIGPIIPPSIPMVLYALVSNTSIGYLFLGGIVPGLMMGVVLMAMNTRHLASPGLRAGRTHVPLSQLPAARRMTAFPALLMPAILLYGIYGGVTTPTEAAAVAAFYALNACRPLSTGRSA
jgi:TRAP-type C4-dicarboxylate transport system permease large subunit